MKRLVKGGIGAITWTIGQIGIAAAFESEVEFRVGFSLGKETNHLATGQGDIWFETGMPFIIINESKEGKAEESEVQAGEEEQGEERVSRPLTNKERRQAKSAAKRATAQATPTKTLASDAQPSGEKKKRKRVEMADSGAEQPAQEGATKRAEAGEEGPGGAGAGGEEDEEEVEALSHKERRKRKKLEKAAARSGEAGDGTNGQPSNVPAWGPNAPNPAAAAAAQAKRLPRSNFSIWVGNLSFQTSTDRLKSWLEEQGCEGISRLHMPAGAKRGEHNKG